MVSPDLILGVAGAFATALPSLAAAIAAGRARRDVRAQGVPANGGPNMLGLLNRLASDIQDVSDDVATITTKLDAHLALGREPASPGPSQTVVVNTHPTDTHPADTHPADTHPADTHPADTHPADADPAIPSPAPPPIGH